MSLVLVMGSGDTGRGLGSCLETALCPGTRSAGSPGGVCSSGLWLWCDREGEP